MRPFVSLILALGLATSSTLAAPAPKGAPPGYEAKYKEVVDAEKAEEYEKALTLLDQIPADKQNVYSRLKRAGLLVRLGKFVEAEAVLSTLVKDPAADVIRATAQSDLEDVRARMPKLTIRMAKGSGTDVWVTLDGKPVGPPVMLPVNPGAHVIVAARGGKDVFKQNVTLQDSQALEVEIDTSVAPPAPPVASVSVPTPAAPAAKQDVVEGPSGAKRAMPFLVVGGVFAVGSVVSFVMMGSASSSAEANCAAQHGFGCDGSAAGTGSIKTWQTVGWASAGVALASLGVGVVLWGTTDSKKTAMAVPMVGIGTYGLSFAGGF